jgi:hypothetical protein
VVDWIIEYPEPSSYRKNAGVRDARTVFNRLVTPEFFLELSTCLAKADALLPDLLKRAEEMVRVVGPKKDGSDNLAGQAAAFRKVIPFATMVGALRAYKIKCASSPATLRPVRLPR